MKRVDTLLKSEAMAAASAALKSGLSQDQIASYVGASQSQVSRILSGKSLRRSKLFDKVCIYAYESLHQTQGKPKPAASSCSELLAALDAVWDGTDRHARALATVIRSLGSLMAPHDPSAKVSSLSAGSDRAHSRGKSK